MSNHNNHIDNWLQESAALGNISVAPADWMAMQQLLQQKRKRRFGFFWWYVAGILILLGLLAYYFINKHNNVTVPQNISATKSVSQSAYSPDVVINSDTQNISESNINNTDLISTTSKKTKTEILQHVVKNNTTVVKVRKSDTLKTRTTRKTIITNITDAENVKTKSVESFIKDDSKFVLKPTVAPATSAKNIINKLDALKQATPKYSPNIVYMHNRYIDSLANKKDSNLAIVTDTTKKSKPSAIATVTTPQKNKKTSLKSFTQINVGYGVMNTATSLNTGLLQLQYSLNIIKNVFIDITATAMPYSNSNIEKHKNIYRIVPPVPGTAFTEVDIKETSYNIANGFIAEPGIGLHYNYKKFELGAACHYGMVMNSANTTTFIYDTFNFFNPLPASIRLNTAYDENNFVGKKYNTVSLHSSYMITKKWLAQLGYAYTYWYNTVDGVADDNRKRSSFYITVGYRF